VLAARGYAQYEVSAFARAGRQCRHNLNYWRFGDYLGIGAGAHGKLTLASDAGAWLIERSTHLREPRRYLASAAQGPAWKPVPDQDLPFEFAMNALRLNEGFEPELFTSRTGLPFSRIEATLRRLESQGLMEANGHWRASPRGRQLLNELVQRFLPGRNSEATAGS
jgi:oxygen-independent coproporphyrinogen-3 oxidase